MESLVVRLIRFAMRRVVLDLSSPLELCFGSSCEEGLMAICISSGEAPIDQSV